MADDKKMITRAEYMADDTITHEDYYGQFVDDYINNVVLHRILYETIVTCKDKHFNSIALPIWDSLHGTISSYTGLSTLSDSVCIAKEAARRMRETYRKGQ